MLITEHSICGMLAILIAHYGRDSKEVMAYWRFITHVSCSIVS